jgi:hypothetical protein
VLSGTYSGSARIYIFRSSREIIIGIRKNTQMYGNINRKFAIKIAIDKVTMGRE